MDACEHTCRVCAALENPNLPARFWAKVNAGSATECWLWTAHTNDRGYGRFDVGGVPEYAHRMAYRLTFGPVPHGLEVDHMCWTPACVNPAHLRAVTPAVNQANKRASPSDNQQGISWNEKRQRWQVKISHMGREFWGGRFAERSEADAALRRLRETVQGAARDTSGVTA